MRQICGVPAQTLLDIDREISNLSLSEIDKLLHSIEIGIIRDSNNLNFNTLNNTSGLLFEHPNFQP